MSIAIGDVFGDLVVIGEGIRRNSAICSCRCGTEKEVLVRYLFDGSTRSCGCMRGRRYWQYKGLAAYKSIEYRSYRKMIRRCHRKVGIARYERLGISVCDRWRFGENGRSGFECFVEDMGPKPGRAYDIDRYPDKRGNYEPKNCRWATRKQNSNNAVTNHLITAYGETKTIAEWGEDIRCAVLSNTFRWRIHLGWDPERALRKPSARDKGRRR